MSSLKAESRDALARQFPYIGPSSVCYPPGRPYRNACFREVCLHDRGTAPYAETPRQSRRLHEPCVVIFSITPDGECERREQRRKLGLRGSASGPRADGRNGPSSIPLMLRMAALVKKHVANRPTSRPSYGTSRCLCPTRQIGDCGRSEYRYKSIARA